MKKTLCLLCFLFLMAACGAQSQTIASASSGDTPHTKPGTKFAAGYEHLPLSFEANEGQIDARVQFLSHAPGYALFLQPDAATLSLHRAVVARTGSGRKTKPAQEQSSVVRMRLPGASATAKGAGEEVLPGKTSYLLGNDPAHWHASLANYRRVKYRQVYPGIDLVYYGTNGELEYDFELSAGADPSLIRMHFDGVVPSIGAAGDVALKIAGSSINLHRPVLYQQVDGRRVPVSGSFASNRDGDLVFKTGSYDRSVPLVIDPLLQFSSYLGGVTANNTTINGMAVDSTGAIYVTGTTAQTDFPVTAGAAITTCPSDISGSKCGAFAPGTAFVSKIAADGQSLIYSTYMGGSGSQNGSEQGHAIAVNTAGEAWVAGLTSSPSFPITSDAIEPYCNPQSPNPFAGQTGIQSTCGNSQFLVKLNAAGTAITYGTFFGGTQETYVNAIALDAGGNVYFTGTDSGSDFAAMGPYTRSGIYVLDSAGNYLYPTTTSAFQQTGPEYELGYLTKLSADGHTLLYSTIFASPSATAAGRTFSLALAVSGNQATIGGYTNSSSLPVTAGAIQSSCTANASNCVIYVPWLASFDTSKSGAASLVFSTYLEGSSQVSSPGDTDLVSALATDASGNIYVGGYTQQPLFPTTTGAFQPTCKAIDQGFGPLCNTGFVTKLTPAGAITWSTFFGSPTGGGETGAIALALDSSNNVYIADGNAVSDTPTNGSLMAAANGSAYVAELSSDGTAEPFGTFYGNGGVINVSAIAVDSANDIFLVGATNESLPLVNAYQSANSNGSSEGFFAKINHLSTSATTLTVSPSTTITGQSVTFTATVAGTVQTTPAPTGTVTLTNTSVTPNATLGTIQLTNGTGTFTTTQLAAATYSVSAAYSGDDVYYTSASSATALTIHTPATATVVLTAPSAAKLGASVTLGATVSGATGTPTGTVSFYDGGSLLGTGTLSGGKATYSTTSLGLGSSSITATYSGDSTFGSASSTSSAIDITTAATIALTVRATATVGSSVTLSVALTGPGATPTGSVTFLDGTTTLNTATLSGGKASYSTAALAVGAHSITVQYGGDMNYAAGTSTAQTVTVSALTPAIALTAPATANVGSSVTLSVALTGSGATPTGTVKFLDGTTTLNTAMLVAGTASYSTSTLAVGAHSITVQYSGDTEYAAGASTAQAITVSALTPSIALTVPATANGGGSVTLSVALTGSGATPTGTVKFLDGTTTLNTATLSGGKASFATASLTVGAHSITAQYSGDSNYSAATSTASTLTIAPLTPAVALTVSPASAVAGASISLSAMVSSAAGTPTGTVNFLDGTTLLNSAMLASGTATYSTTSLSVGTHTITATYSGDATFAPFTTAAQTVTITAIPPSVALTASPASLSIASGGSGTTVITATPAGGYTGALALSCGALPTDVSCSFSTSTITISGTSAESSTLTISTTATQARLDGSPEQNLGLKTFAALLLPMLLFARKRRQGKRGPWIVLPALLLCIFAAGAMTGCGGSASKPVTTTPGSYSLTVNATAGTTTDSLNLQVTVQ